MSFVRLLSDLEELIIQFVMLFVLAPKTLVRVLFRPRSLPEYVALELRKPAEQRYDTQVSPVVFWILFCILPAIIAVHLWSSAWQELVAALSAGLGGPRVERPDFWAIDLSPATISYGITLAIWFPLAFAVVPVIAKRVPVARSTLYGSLQLQCYVFGGATMGFILLDVSCLFISPHWMSVPGLTDFLVSPVALLFMVWWLIAFETRLFCNELSKPWWSALLLITAACVLAISGITCTYWLLHRLPPIFTS